MKPWVAKGLAVTVAVSVGVGVGFLWPPNAGSAPADGPAQAWIDDPLDGTTVDLGPVEVVAHAFDPSGLAGITLTVEGEVVADDPLDDVGVLAYGTWTWTPDSEGVYVLEAYGTGKTGIQGLAGRAVVIVGLPRSTAPTTLTGSTTTTVPSTTTTTPAESITTAAPATTRPTPPTTTAPPTTTPPTTAPPTTAPTTTNPGPCTPPAPILLSPTDGATFVGPDQSITLDWSAWRGSPPACQPSGFYAELAYSPGARPVASQHLGPGTTEWTPPRTAWSCNADHFWRVYSKRADGSLGAVSDIWHIRIDCIS